MLSMTLRSFIRQPVRPVVFVPVYLGYERVIEIESYVGELSGKPKEKESLWGFVSSLRRLRENFGSVHVNIGEPIALTPLLDAHHPGWRERTGEGARGGFAAVADVLAQRIMRNIHAAAAVTPVNLLALAMLATPRQALQEGDLRRQLELMLALLRTAPYSDRMTCTRLDAAGILELGLARGLLVRDAGETLSLAPAHAAAMPWYANNVVHLVALPSLLACCFLSGDSHDHVDLHRMVAALYPYLSAELFLRWDEAEVSAAVNAKLAALRDAGLLLGGDGSPWRAAPAASAEAMQLSLLARPMLRTIERYYLVVALLLRAGSGRLSQAELGQQCQQMAQQMERLYGFYSPDFFDRTLFEGFVGQLRRRGVLRADADGKLIYGDELRQLAQEARLVLSEQLRHSILQVVHG
jgi:glycerol-3-phosphate O-acyltransferase